jgi:carbamoyltransferase
MNVVGFSGFDRAVSFKKQAFPGLAPQEYRMVQGMDAAAALVSDRGIVAAVAEERFCGEKGTNRFPKSAIESCLGIGGIRLADVETFAHAFRYDKPVATTPDQLEARQFDEVYSRAALVRTMQERLGDGPWADKLVLVRHHIAHAASAYFPSGFGEALVFVCDGMGEEDSATVAVASGGKFETLARVAHRNSLGVLYSLFALHLGFRFNSGEYKMMGLAPYGRAERYLSKVSDLVRLQDDGCYSIPILQMNATELERETNRGARRVLEELFGQARAPESEITQDHKDLAAAVQAVLVRTLLHTLGHFRRETKLKKLCMAGGVALNCSANGVILRSRLFDDVFVQPGAGDDGAALGAALFVHRAAADRVGSERMTLPFWGEEAREEQIASAVRGFCAQHPGTNAVRFDDSQELYMQVAKRLASGKILACFQGRMEFGPRALGNRSILADPRGVEMRAKINALVKKREEFRPFAPAVLASQVDKYFEVRAKDARVFEHMLFVADVRPEYRDELPAITHVDGSARVQTVFAEHNPIFAGLLEAFQRETGMPMLLNTSFNVRGQPIVRTPEEALDTFAEARLDGLVIGQWLVAGDL